MPFNARSFVSLARSAARLLRQVSATGAQPQGTPSGPRAGTGARTPSPRTPSPSPGLRPGAGRAGKNSAAGDYQGPLSPAYAPQPDGDPDPGEVVWAWVPYEDDPSQGKDRPVLLIGRNRGLLLGLMMTSRDRNNSRSADPRYLDVGTGPWDSKGRPSEVKLDRVLQLAPEDVRREGAVMDESVFRRVAAALAKQSPAR